MTEVGDQRDGQASLPLPSNGGQSTSSSSSSSDDPSSSSTTTITTTSSTPPPDSLIDHTCSIDYWSQTPATVTGMLGGYAQISRIDLHGSRSFLSKLRRRHPNGAFRAGGSKRVALGVDCGAGIGRITDGLLRDVCETVDVVEPVAKFADTLRRESRAAAEGRVGDVYVTGLQDWTPCPQKSYDLVWHQWCLGHLRDGQLVDHLRRCARCLVPPRQTDGEAGGWIIVKENMSTDPDGQDVYDVLDSSVTRTDVKFRALFDAAGLEVVRSELQLGFPKALNLLPVRMYGLRPRTRE